MLDYSLEYRTPENPEQVQVLPIQIPSSVLDLRLSHFQMMLAAEQASGEDKDIAIVLALAKCFNISEEVLVGCSTEQLSYIFNAICALIPEAQNVSFAPSFELYGITYTFTPPKHCSFLENIELIDLAKYRDAFGDFSSHLLAILFKAKGEKMPLYAAEREQFISDKAAMFSELPLHYFLHTPTIHQEYIAEINTLYFDKFRKPNPTAPEVKEQLSKAAAAAKRSLETVGYISMLYSVCNNIADLPRIAQMNGYEAFKYMLHLNQSQII